LWPSLNSLKRTRDPDEIRGAGRRRRGDRERHRKLAEIQANTNTTIGPEAELVEVASIVVDALYPDEWLKVSDHGQWLIADAGEHRLDECGAQRTAIPPR
jgi:hypothetical protein